MRYWAKIEDQNLMVFKHPKSKKDQLLKYDCIVTHPKSERFFFKWTESPPLPKSQKKINF